MLETDVRERLEQMCSAGLDFWVLSDAVEQERDRLGERSFHELWFYAWALVRTERSASPFGPDDDEHEIRH